MAIPTRVIRLIFVNYCFYSQASQLIVMYECLFYFKTFTSLSGKPFKYAFKYNTRGIVCQLALCPTIALSY